MAAKFREGHRAHYDDGHGVVAHDHDTKPTTRQTAILTLNGVKQYLRAHPERRSTAASEVRAALREFTHSLNTPDSVNVIAAWPRHAEAPATFPNAPNGTEAVV